MNTMMPLTMSDDDWERLADAELTHDAATARIEVGHLHDTLSTPTEAAPWKT